MEREITHSRSALEPNDWVTYVDADTNEVIHIDRFNEPRRAAKRFPGPPEGWEHGDIV